MNVFDVHALVYVLHEVSQSEGGLLVQKLLIRQNIVGPSANQRKIPDSVLQKADTALALAEGLFRTHDIGNCLKSTNKAINQWKRTSDLDLAAACEILHRLQIDIVVDLQNTCFLSVAETRSSFVEHASLFGQHVRDSFGSATDDIREAGNCLAAECNTAAVFHLTRASEVALRALAVDRMVSFASKPLDQREWGTILGSLEGKLKEMRQDDGKNWPNLVFKEAQIRFYNEVVQELRGFNEAWRRHIAHADTKAFYDHDLAGGVMKHVREFMQKLAARISENKTLPKYWDFE